MQQPNHSHADSTKIKPELQTYVVVLENGEQHFVQARNEQEVAAVLRMELLNSSNQTLNGTKNIQPNIDDSIFRSVIEYVKQLYNDLSTERGLRAYYCLFCAKESDNINSLVNHITDVHKSKIIDGSLDVQQDFRPIVESKILQAQQKRTVITENLQLYQCIQCQQRFRSWETITDHLAECQTTNDATVTPKVNEVKLNLPSGTDLSQYVPYGCASCGQRWFTIKELSEHIENCVEDSFHDSRKFLRPQSWIEAPKNQHIVINEDSTNVTLKTTGLWLMPEPPGAHEVKDGIRGFWVMPSSTTVFYENAHQTKIKVEEPSPKIETNQNIQQPQQIWYSDQQQTIEIDSNYLEIETEEKSEFYEINGNVQRSFDSHSENVVDNEIAGVIFGENLPSNETIYDISGPIELTSPETEFEINESFGSEVELSETPSEKCNRKRGRPQKSHNSKKIVKNLDKKGRISSSTAEESPKIEAIVNILPPEQKYYLAYDENGVLTPIEQNIDTVTLEEKNTLNTAVQSIMSSPPIDIFNETNNGNYQQYNVDDLSHLDEPIPIKNDSISLKRPKKRKLEFVDSFFKFLKQRQKQNKCTKERTKIM